MTRTWDSSTSRKTAFAGVQRMRAEPACNMVPILTYHSLDNSGSVISTTRETFRRQICWLSDRGFTGICLSDLLEAWDGAADLPRRPVVITFDDGFENVLTHAAPLLKEISFGATVFAVAGYNGKTNDWPERGKSIPRLPLLSWSGLRDLASAGFELGSHTITHPVLTEQVGEEAEHEIVDSKRIIEDRIGQAVTVFAYPYGLASQVHLNMVRAHYRGAVSVALRSARSGDDLHWLPRVDMYYHRNMSLFRLLGTRLGHSYLTIRACGRAFRAVVESCHFPSRNRPA